MQRAYIDEGIEIGIWKQSDLVRREEGELRGSDFRLNYREITEISKAEYLAIGKNGFEIGLCDGKRWRDIKKTISGVTQHSKDITDAAITRPQLANDPAV
jgi:hypothetical protein